MWAGGIHRSGRDHPELDAKGVGAHPLRTSRAAAGAVLPHDDVRQERPGRYPYHDAAAQPGEMCIRDRRVYCGFQNVSLTPVLISRQVFENAPVSAQYPQEMYYRLLDPQQMCIRERYQ